MDVNRRSFLFGSAAATVFAGCSTAKAGLRALRPGEKRTVAMIGCGKQSLTLLEQFLGVHGECRKLRETVRVAAVCDCDRVRVAERAKLVNKTYGDTACRQFADFRDVLADPTIDAVCIATPDHWHAYMSVEAMKRGKDVYCEKPLTFSIDEARKVIAAQEKYGRIFQTGSMQRSWRVFRDAVALVRGGAIGTLKYVDANYGQGGGAKLGGPSHPVRFFDKPENAAAEGVPNPDVDWNMWLGPAAWRPYSEQLAPRGPALHYPMFWRFDDDIGSGYNGDWGAHHLDIAQWGLDADKSGPYRIVRSDEPYSTNPLHGGRRQYGMKMLFKTPSGDVELYHGPFGVWGTVFYGTKGIVAVNRGKIAVWSWTDAALCVKPTAEIRRQLQDGSYLRDRLFAASIGKDYGTDATVKADNRLSAVLGRIEKQFAAAIEKAGLYRSPNQVVNFCECIETRKPTISPAEVGGRGATLCLLCNMSYRYDTGFDWDGEKMDFAGCNRKGLPLARADYRGWDIVV